MQKFPNIPDLCDLLRECRAELKNLSMKPPTWDKNLSRRGGSLLDRIDQALGICGPHPPPQGAPPETEDDPSPFAAPALIQATDLYVLGRCLIELSRLKDWEQKKVCIARLEQLNKLYQAEGERG